MQAPAKASAAGREIGKKGRPTKLNEEQIKVFIDRVQEELQNGSEINYELAILMVWILSFKMEILTFVLGRERLVHLELWKFSYHQAQFWLRLGAKDFQEMGYCNEEASNCRGSKIKNMFLI